MFFYRLFDVPSYLLEKFVEICVLYVDRHIDFAYDVIHSMRDVRSGSFSCTRLKANTERDSCDKDMIILK